MYRGFRKGWDIVSGGPATEGGIYKSIDGGETWNKLSAGLPQKLIGKIDLDIARSNPRVVYAMVEAPGAEGGLYRVRRCRRHVALVNNNPRLRARPFYFHYVDVNPKNENEVWVNELALHKSTDGGKTFTHVATPHGDNHGMWFNPDNPSIALQCNDGGANVTLDGGRTLVVAFSISRPRSSTWCRWTSSSRIGSTRRSRTTPRSSFPACRRSRGATTTRRRPGRRARAARRGRSIRVRTAR